MSSAFISNAVKNGGLTRPYSLVSLLKGNEAVSIAFPGRSGRMPDGQMPSSVQ